MQADSLHLTTCLRPALLSCLVHGEAATLPGTARQATPRPVDY